MLDNSGLTPLMVAVHGAEMMDGENTIEVVRASYHTHLLVHHLQLPVQHHVAGTAVLVRGQTSQQIHPDLHRRK